MKSKNIKSLGIDLSLVGTGIVLLNNGKLEKKRLIKSKPLGDLPVDELKRILQIVEDIELIVTDDLPMIAVIEGMAFMARNTTALVQLSALNYMTRTLLFNYKIPFIIVVGEREKQNNTITVRDREGKQETVSLDKFIEEKQKEVLEK